MNDLHRALGDIRNIRRQVAESTEFRGYGPLTLCATAVFAIAAGFVQARWVPQPQLAPIPFTLIWSATALLSAAVIAIQTLNRTHRLHSGLADEMIRMAAVQFLPAALTGTLVTVTIVRFAPQILWTLPGLWQIVYSLGVFASCRFLPRPIGAAGTWYLATGVLTLALGDARALSPLLLSGAFAIGQTLIAAILYMRSSEAADEA